MDALLSSSSSSASSYSSRALSNETPRSNWSCHTRAARARALVLVKRDGRAHDRHARSPEFHRARVVGPLRLLILNDLVEVMLKESKDGVLQASFEHEDAVQETAVCGC